VVLAWYRGPGGWKSAQSGGEVGAGASAGAEMVVVPSIRGLLRPKWVRACARRRSGQGPHLALGGISGVAGGALGWVACMVADHRGFVGEESRARV